MDNLPVARPMQSHSFMTFLACALMAGTFTTCLGFMTAAAASAADRQDLSRLLRAYPEHLAGLDGNILVWKNGTRMPVDDGRGKKTFVEWLAQPDIKDMLAIPYPAGGTPRPPVRDSDPGRARNAAFFKEMYGDCKTGSVAPHLVDIVWLPKKAPQRLKVTRINGVAAKLEAVSRELDDLPHRFDRFLVPSAGTYNCRSIAGTSSMSAHSYGIAIDIAVRPAHYWRWSSPQPDGIYPYRNAIPLEIVRIFEKHGFIWGGAWYHYDTMHFEYRPELLTR
jgi:hypothetical protein